MLKFEFKRGIKKTNTCTLFCVSVCLCTFVFVIFLKQNKNGLKGRKRKFKKNTVVVVIYDYLGKF